MLFSAWIDESGSDSRRDPGTYLLAAAVCEDSALALIRDRMADLLLPGQRKVHWRDERPARRVALTTAVTELPVEHIVAVRCDAEQRPERRRRLCLQKVLIELAALGVTQATAESRGPRDDARDREMLTYLRAAGVLDSALRLHHAAGPSDPALWVPDVCCGVVSAHRLGHNEYWDALADRITLHDVT